MQSIQQIKESLKNILGWQVFSKIESLKDVLRHIGQFLVLVFATFHKFWEGELMPVFCLR